MARYAVSTRIGESEVLALLSGLVEKSLVITELTAQSGRVRYRLLDPIRQYALEKLWSTAGRSRR